MALQIGLSEFPFFIAAGRSLSAGVAIGAQRVVGLSMPAVWDAAVVTVQASLDDGANFAESLDSAGNPVQIAAGAGQFIALTTELWSAVNFLKLRSGTAAVPVTQSADRTLQLIVRS